MSEVRLDPQIGGSVFLLVSLETQQRGEPTPQEEERERESYLYIYT